MKRRVIALVRQVPNSFAQALTSAPAGSAPIDVSLARRQWDAYVSTLRRFVDEVQVLPADESHPDCCFIEDTLVYARGTSVLTNPGHPSRQGEVAGVKAWLQQSESAIQNIRLKSLQDIDSDATLDGGDCLFTGRHMFVGITARTNAAGAAALQQAFGASLPVVPIKVHDLGSSSDTQSSALHLKSLMTALKPDLLCFAGTPEGYELAGRMADAVGKSAYKGIAVPDPVTANALSIGFGHWRGALIQGDRCDKSVGFMRGAFELSEQNSMIELQMSEFIKADGALTCLSVLLESVHT